MWRDKRKGLRLKIWFRFSQCEILNPFSFVTLGLRQSNMQANTRMGCKSGVTVCLFLDWFDVNNYWRTLNGCTFKRAISVMWLGFISLTCDLPKQPLLSERIYQDTFGSVSEHPLSDSSPYRRCSETVLIRRCSTRTRNASGLVGIEGGQW